MNAWEHVALIAADLAPELDATEASVVEYANGLADERAIQRLPLVARIKFDTTAYWHQFEAQATSEYATHIIATKLDDSLKLVSLMTAQWCKGKLNRTEIEWLRGLNRGIDKRLEARRQERAAELRTEVLLWEREVMLAIVVVGPLSAGVEKTLAKAA